MSSEGHSLATSEGQSVAGKGRPGRRRGVGDQLRTDSPHTARRRCIPVLAHASNSRSAMVTELPGSAWLRRNSLSLSRDKG